MRKFFCLSFLVLAGITEISAQYTKIRGTITDEVTGEPLPFVNIFFKNTSVFAQTDDKGKYFLETRYAKDSLNISYVGYLPQTIKIKKGVYQVVDIQLKPDVVQLKDVIVKPGENPAHRLLKKVIKNKEINDNRNVESYSCEIYNKLQIDLNNIDEKFKQKKILKPFEFIWENLDTNALTGKVFLPVLISETVSDFYYKKNPKEERELIKANQVSGIRNESITQFTGQMTHSFNIYDNFMTFYEKGFISPISDLGLLYYRYYLTDSLVLDGHWCYNISFKPIRKQERTFTGDMWIADTIFAVKKIKMKLNPEANLNFITGLAASYEFKEFNDSIWFLSQEEVLADFNITETDKIKGFFGHKTAFYRNYKLDYKPSTLKEQNVDVWVSDSAINYGKAYWDTIRPEKLSVKEEKVYKMVDSIKNVPLYRTFVDIINLMVNYHYELGKFDIGPYYTLYSFNEIEGNRFRIGGRTNKYFSKKYQHSGYIALSDKEHSFKFGLGSTVIFDKLPRRAVGYYVRHDIEQLGRSISSFNTDNILTSILKRNPNYKLGMINQATMFYEHEWWQGFSNKITFNHLRVYSTPYIPLIKVRGNDSTIYDKVIASEFTLQTHYAYKEKFIVGELQRVKVRTKYPVFDLYLTYGAKNLFNSQNDYLKVNLSVSQSVNLSPFGIFKYLLETGRIFGSLPYPLLELHKGNETYAFDANAFNMMNYYEFVSDKYVSITAEQHFQGFFLNYIPLLRKLKLREVATFRGLIGSLDERNHNYMRFPDGLTDVKKPYFEAGVGIENIIKVIRVDAMWRLSHLDHDRIEIFGLRASLQITF